MTCPMGYGSSSPEEDDEEFIRINTKEGEGQHAMAPGGGMGNDAGRDKERQTDVMFYTNKNNYGLAPATSDGGRLSRAQSQSS